MDGHISLMRFDRKFVRPFDHCISRENLSYDNLPPFLVRLRNDQALELSQWTKGRNPVLNKTEISCYWPFDFNTNGVLRPERVGWNSPAECAADPTLMYSLPEYVPVPLPPNFTTSGKAMVDGLPSRPRDRKDKIADDTINELRAALLSKDLQIAKLSKEVFTARTDAKTPSRKSHRSQEILDMDAPNVVKA